MRRTIECGRVEGSQPCRWRTPAGLICLVRHAVGECPLFQRNHRPLPRLRTTDIPFNLSAQQRFHSRELRHSDKHHEESCNTGQKVVLEIASTITTVTPSPSRPMSCFTHHFRSSTTISSDPGDGSADRERETLKSAATTSGAPEQIWGSLATNRRGICQGGIRRGEPAEKRSA